MWYHLGVKSIYFNNDAMLFWMQFCLMMTFGWPIDGCGAAYIFWFEIYLVASVSIVMMWMTLYWNPKLIFSDWQSKYNDAYISFSMFMLHLFPDIIDLVLSFGFAYLLVDYGCYTCNKIFTKRGITKMVIIHSSAIQWSMRDYSCNNSILDFVCKTLESKWIACDLGSTCGLNDALCNDMVLGTISPNLIWTNT